MSSFVSHQELINNGPNSSEISFDTDNNKFSSLFPRNNRGIQIMGIDKFDNPVVIIKISNTFDMTSYYKYLPFINDNKCYNISIKYQKKHNDIYHNNIQIEKLDVKNVVSCIMNFHNWEKSYECLKILKFGVDIKFVIDTLCFKYETRIQMLRAEHEDKIKKIKNDHIESDKMNDKIIRENAKLQLENVSLEMHNVNMQENIKKSNEEINTLKKQNVNFEIEKRKLDDLLYSQGKRTNIYEVNLTTDNDGDIIKVTKRLKSTHDN